MKLSIEAKVAVFVGAGFVALTVGVIAQGNSGDQSAGLKGYGQAAKAEVNTNTGRHGYDSSLAGPARADDNKHRSQWQLRSD